jgi:DNA repair exonuclease SbcCD ATPase subunit/DNA repair exonuclease SbcCD nuclease subunit
MIKKIAHLADIHIRKVPVRNDEYEEVFKNLIKSLEKEKPDRIVVVGDLVHDYLDLQGEQLILAHDLLNTLAMIAPVRITRGNHDCRKKNLKRVDSIRAIVKTLNNPNVEYYDKTTLYQDDNVVWAVWHHGDQKNNPWKTKAGKEFLSGRTDGQIAIDLFHDPISGCKSTTGFEMKSKSYYKLSEFKGDLSMFGDIHRMQYLDALHTKAYCGSLIAQDVSEGDDNFHGYLLWHLDSMSAEEFPIKNNYSFKNVKITPFTDFDDLELDIPNPTKHMRVRFVWGTLPQSRTKDNERKLVEFLKSQHKNVIISHKNEFIEADKMDVNENVTIENISDEAVQHEIFKEYLEKIGTDPQLVADIIALDEEITASITLDEVSNLEWNVIKFGGRNFASYANIDVDWRDMDGLFQITGINTAGKTTIMKLITYILFGKSLETESRKQFGDSRFVNNRNGATFCEGYIVIEANGEYYGIKKKTTIEKNKSGEIKGAPTTLSYYLLSNPDEEMDDNTVLEKLDDDRRIKTQKNLDIILGTYDNFMRIVMTTSDTLNRILSNDMAVFIDSLLFDTGLDIFDKKLEGLKVYQKKANERNRVTCNVEATTSQNQQYLEDIRLLDAEVLDYETIKIPEVQGKIQTGRTYVETLTKKLFKIDPEIANLSVDSVKKTIGIHNETIKQHNQRKGILETSIAALRETYDAERLQQLTWKKDAHKTNEYTNRMVIKGHEQTIMAAEHQIEIFNGYVLRHKQQGAQYKKDIQELKDSKICPTCGQLLTAEHQDHITEKIKAVEALMFPLADDIKKWLSVDIKNNQDVIDAKNKEITGVKTIIENDALEMESTLKEIGTLTNEMNDVNRRKELQVELDQIPVKIQNEELKISILQQKIDNYDNNILQIEENQKIEKGIVAAKDKIRLLENDERELTEDLYLKKTAIADRQIRIKNNELLIVEFKIQEYQDSVMALYKKCVHRDGIPKQMLVNYILPKINLTLENILSVAQFKVWLDEDDLRPKLVYNSRPGAVIDCISASGKERTFSSVVLKFALNQINIKAKPMMFLLDEVMGKLSDESVEEFIEILHVIKNHMKKTLVIEHKEEINPDYLINVTVDEDGISSLVLE